MSKAIRTLAIIATGVSAISLLLLLISIPFQQVIAAELFGSPEDILSYLPRFPLAAFINCLFETAAIALAIICCGNKKGGIWLEILLIASISIVIPLSYYLFNILRNAMIGRAMGSLYYTSESIITQIASSCLVPTTLAKVLITMTCGMSIAYKLMTKNRQRDVSAS